METHYLRLTELNNTRKINRENAFNWPPRNGPKSLLPENSESYNYYPVLIPINREIELVGGRYDGMKREVSPGDYQVIINELDPLTGVAAQYIYIKEDEKHFKFEKCFAISK
jgi:hypothetical protein